MTTDFANATDEWVREYLQPRYPELVHAFLDAQTSHTHAMATGRIAPSALERLVAHARSPRTPLGENVAAMIGNLYAKIPSLEAAIRALATGSRVHERVNALVALDSGPPTELHVELLACLLQDKSARVRALAADKIVVHRLEALASALEAAAARERNPRVADHLRSSIDYLRQRFHVLQVNESFWVTCRPRPGGSSVSKLFTQAQFETTAPAWIASVLSEARDEA